MADSVLSPREIQARVRAGASVAEVAEAAGVSEEHVEPFAGPVLAERAYVVGTALECPVRRRGEPSSNRNLREIITDRLRTHSVAFDDVDLDAWRDDDRRWHISARYTVAGEDRVAELLFDSRARFSIPGNDEGRWLVGEQPAGAGLARDPDSEPTVDLNDEWAIVRAVQEGDHDEVAPTSLRTPGEPTAVAEDESEADQAEVAAPIPIRRTARRGTSGDPPDYTPAQLEAVDGVYDIVPHESEMDVLYEMLAGFNEDSVKIYAGLTQPVIDHDDPQVEDPGTAEEPVPAAPEETSVASVDVVMVEATYQEYEVTTETSEPTRRIRRTKSKADPADSSSTQSPAKPAAARSKRASSEASADSTTASEPSQSKPSRRGRKKGRAQVPSWDEIMFGGPPSTPDEDR